MTKLEQEQPDHVFLSAGRHAQQLGVSSNENPYTSASGGPRDFAKLWNDGWQEAAKTAPTPRATRE